ncbi:MAG: lysophospholipase, partial [Planctomycetes bacterium]|nr:lysophospholipase [Planctomycetota bacterium]
MLPRSPRILALALTLPLSSCSLTRQFDPPAMLPAKVVPLEEALTFYPPGTQLLRLTPTPALHGLYVPSDPSAPVVLHLLDSSGSLASPKLHLGELAAQLSDLGLASLIFDYTGVGVSEGTRSVRNLAQDAQCAWREAVRRAGGDPGRVVVRAISIGTIAAGQLLASGARPAAVVLIAPVFPDTLAPRFAAQAYSPLVGGIARLCLRPIADLDLAAVIAGSSVPATVIGSPEDELVSEEELESLGRAADQSGGRLVPRPGGHLVVSAEARWLLDEELSLYRELASPPAAERLDRILADLSPDIAARFPEGSAERARLQQLALLQRESPAVQVAAAASTNENSLAAARFLWLARRRPYPELDFDDLAATLSLQDPAGELSIESLESSSRGPDLDQRYRCGWLMMDAEQIGHAAA